MQVSGRNFEAVFDKGQGGLVAYRVNGRELMAAGGRPELSRAQTDNERRQKQKPSPALDTAGETARVISFNAQQVGGAARITVCKTLPEVQAGFASVYTVQPSGEVVVEAAFDFSHTPKKQRPPLRVGMEWQVVGGLEQLSWYGRGGETYIDRNFEPIGRYESTVDGEWTDYPRPQENGNKTDVRWAALSDASGAGLPVAAEGMPLGLGARHYSRPTMRESDYSFQMERSDNIFLNIDAAQSGVGGINSWGAMPLEKHRLNQAVYAYAYRLLPMFGSVADALSRRAAFEPSDVQKLARQSAASFTE